MATVGTSPKRAYVYDSGSDTWFPIGGAAFSAGSASAPSISFSGDSDTGLWSPAADTVAFSTGGSERLRIDSSGNVGIGTNSPGGPLHVVDKGVGRDFISELNADTVFGFRHLFYKSRGTTSAKTIVANNDEIGQILFLGYDGSAFRTAALIQAQVDGTPGSSDMPGRLVFHTSADGTSALSERMRITSAGGIAIGDTTTSGAKLKIGNGSDNAYIVQHGAANFVGMSIRNDQSTTSANSTSYIDTQNENAVADGHLFFVHETDGSSTFIVGATPAGSKSSDRRVERLRITGAGNVGIGTTSPGRALDVASASSVPIRMTTASSSTGVIEQLNSRGTLASPTATQAADRIGGLIAQGHDGTAYVLAARIMVEANQNFSPTARGSRFTVQVTPDDSTTATERMRVAGDGLITGTGTSLGAWTAYTPTLGGTGWAIGNGTAVGAYCQIGKVVIFRAKLAFGSTSTYGAAQPTLSLPVGLSSGHQGQNAQFHVSYLDLSAGAFYSGVTRTQTATTVNLNSLGTNSVHNSVSSTVPFTWASTDEITVNGTYEIA